MTTSPPGVPTMHEILALNLMAWVMDMAGKGPRYGFDWVSMTKCRRRFYSVFDREEKTLVILDRRPTAYEWRQLQEWLTDRLVNPLKLRKLSKEVPKNYKDRIEGLVELAQMRGSSDHNMTILWVPECPDPELLKTRKILV